MTIEVDEKIAHLLEKLQAQAAERQMPFATYLEQFVESQFVGDGAVSLEEFDAVLDELAASLPDADCLPANFSRQDIYGDHD